MLLKNYAEKKRLHRVPQLCLEHELRCLETKLSKEPGSMAKGTGIRKRSLEGSEKLLNY
jgi:hypothetical protein